MKQVVIVGAGFAGLNAAKRLRDVPGVAVTLIDRENHHLFQPLLYQVAMAALSPADIAVPIRSLFARVRNIRVLKAEVQKVDVAERKVVTDSGEYPYDYLLLGKDARLPEFHPSNPKLALPRRVWASMPLFLTTWLGGRLSRYLP